MSIQRTFSILKPDAVRRNLTGLINSEFEKIGLKIVAQKLIHMSKHQAEKFYEVHKERPFFRSLVDYMISGPVVIQVLEGDDAVKRNRDVMGATNPKEAGKDTIRGKYAESIEANSVHGSDSLENAANEIRFFFSESEIFSDSEK